MKINPNFADAFSVLPVTKVLVFDTETTGLPKKGDEYGDHQPWVIQIAAVLMDLREDRFEPVMNTLVVPPEGVVFEEGAVKAHQLSEEIVRANGREMVDVYAELRELRRGVDIIAAYNLDFDERLVRTCSHRAHPDFIDNPVLGTPEEVQHHCIMKHAMAIFRRRDKLGNVYKKLTGEPLVGAHDALVDTVAAGTVFKHLLMRTLAGN